MPSYIVLFNWTDQGIKNFKDSPDRAEKGTAEMAKSGVHITNIQWTLGPYDLVASVEAPDDETLTSALLTLAAQGNVRSTTLRAFTRDEFNRIIGKS
jgi:uncharacterized protein with GYD domain